MTDKNGSERADEAKFDGVVDELRNVLSGLNRPTPAPENPSISDPFSESFNSELSGPGFSEPDPLPSPAPRKASPSEALATDADFWSGNVLGWPPEGTADTPESPSLLGEPESTEPRPSDNGFLRDGDIEEPKIFAPGDAASSESWMNMPTAEDLIPPAPLAPKAPIELPEAAPSPVASQAASANPWLDTEPAPAPTPAPPPAAEPVFVPIDSAVSEFAPPVFEPAPAAMEPAPKVEFLPPIPGSIDENMPSAAVPAESHELELESKEHRPDNVVQIACLFPEGQEKAGKTFVQRLRESAEKLRAPMAIQAVFVSAWKADNIDLPSWMKSASLSGANLMFVLAPRASARSFDNLVKASTDEIAARFVTLEHVNIPTLYADILVEIRRRR